MKSVNHCLWQWNKQRFYQCIEYGEYHVHIVLSIPPKYAVSEMMGCLKGKLALRLFDRYPDLRKRYWGQHVWSRG